jgi:basic amino acid/polyamine antiporter, APA family
MSQSAQEAPKPLAGSFPDGEQPSSPPVKKPLGLFDAVSIIVGIVIGSGIYQTAPFIFKQTTSPTQALILWGVAGVLSLIGALCYAELASTYPRDGGDIVYLGRAFGGWLGFLFGWVQLTVILTGSIGMLAFIFANYAIRFCQAAFGESLGMASAFLFAGGAVFVLTVTNLLGLVFGKTVQNLLTVIKILSLALLIGVGFCFPLPGAWEQPGLSPAELKAATFPGFTASLGVAMVLILYTYGGWNDSAFVAAEVRNGKKNITRALVIGILLIATLYILVNAAYINVLGFPGAQRSQQIAADVLARSWEPGSTGRVWMEEQYPQLAGYLGRFLGSGGVVAMCVLVMISALGAINGLIFTGARVYSTIGRNHAILSWLSDREGNRRPVAALLTQGALALALIFLVGTPQGRDGINLVLDKVGLKTMEWEAAYLAKIDLPEGEKVARLAEGGFDTLVACTAPIFWLFFLMTGISVFVLRERDTHIERPFKVPLYPEMPLIFCLMCGYMLYSSISYAVSDRGWQGGLVLLGVLPLLIGLILYRLSPIRPVDRSLKEE